MNLTPLGALLHALGQASPVVVDVPVELRYQLLRRYLDLSRRNGRLGLVSWLMTVFGLAHAAPWPAQAGAIATFAALVGLREWRIGHLLNHLDPAVPRSDPLHDVAVLLTTCLWGWAPMFFSRGLSSPLPDANLLGIAFGATLALSGMCVGYLPALPATLLALLVGMLPLTGFFLLRGDLLSAMLALAILFYSVALLQRLRFNHAALVQALITERKNAQLVETLQRYQNALENENVQLNESLRDASLAARHDGLTGLFNRRHLAAFTEALGAGVQDGREAITVCVIDIDHFKGVNDTHGHGVGDEVLKVIALRLGNRLRERDCLARYGGEEFVAVLRRCNLKRGLAVAQALRQGICGETILTSAGPLTLTVSIGLARWTADEVFDGAFQRADRALYRAKQGGRNRVEVEGRDTGGNADSSGFTTTGPAGG